MEVVEHRDLLQSLLRRAAEAFANWSNSKDLAKVRARTLAQAG